MLLLFPVEVVQASLWSSVFSFSKFELLILGILKKFVKLGHLSLLVILYSFLLKSIFLWWIWLFFFKKSSFHLFYLLKQHMKVNGQKWLGIEQRISRKNQKLLALKDKCFFFLLIFNSKAYIMTRYIFNEVRCFFTFHIDFMV